jgi:hypothetical protein
VRTHIRKRFGLTDLEEQTLASAAQTCVAALEENARTGRQLVQELMERPDDASVKARLGALHAARQAAIAAGVQQLRSGFSTNRFSNLDLLVRMRIAPKLRIVPFGASTQMVKGGN